MRRVMTRLASGRFALDSETAAALAFLIERN